MVIGLILDREKFIANIQDKEQVENARRLLDKIEIVLHRHMVQCTDFLDPYERRVATSILNQFMDIDYRELGGIEEAERKIIAIYPHYHILSKEDVDLNYVEISNYTNSFTHRDFLGSILGLGIKREKIGDVFVHKDSTQVVVKSEISDFILLNLNKVGRENVEVKEISAENLCPMEIKYVEKTIDAPSLRLDGVVSNVLNLSRSKGQSLINNKCVKVNWEKINKGHREVNEGDIISVKGYGRFIVFSFLGKTRKDRFKISIRLLK